jgi:hypothetical protein
MKVLFIDARAGGDWGLDLIFAGLVQNLGPENVIDYPAHTKHREAPVVVGDIEKDWGSERRSFSYTPMNSELKSYSESDIIGMLRRKEIDVIFVDERHESYELYMALQAKFFHTPVVVLAGHDTFQNHSPEFVRKTYYSDNLLLMFLDNWKLDYHSLPYSRLLELSVNYDHFWNPSERSQLLSNKIYDICFMGYASHPDRIKCIDYITSKFGHLNNHISLERRPNTFDSFILRRDYFKIMAQSKIVLNLRGAADSGKALRFWEVPYVGSFMLSQRTPANVLTRHPFVEWEHCCYFSSEEELGDKIEWALNNPEAREMIAANGHELIMKEHTSKARVAWMLDEICQELARKRG